MRLVFLLVFFSLSINAFAQFNPVDWSFEAVKISETDYEVVLTAHIATGWAVYSQNLAPSSGPVPTKIVFDQQKGTQFIGDIKEIGLKKEEQDDLSGTVLIKYQRLAKFTQRIKIKSKTKTISGQLTYMTCDDQGCLPPTQLDFAVNLK